MATTTTTIITTTTTPAPTTLSSVQATIFSRPTEAPFVIFVLLWIILIVASIIAILYLKQQQEDHLAKINAVRGFHREDVLEGEKLMSNVGKNASGGTVSAGASMSGGLGGGDQSMNMAMSFAHQHTPPRGDSSFNHALGVDAFAGSTAIHNPQQGSGTHGVNTNPHRLIYDYHRTPTQPSLKKPSAAAGQVHQQGMKELSLSAADNNSGGDGKINGSGVLMNPLNLDALNNNNSISNSSMAASVSPGKSRGVGGLSFGRNPSD